MAKPKKKYFTSMAVLLSAILLLVIGSVMAYFTSTDQTTNKFEGSRFDVFLTETKWDPEKAKGVLPGDELDKNPQITNTEQASAYVYLRVTVPCDTRMVDRDNGEPLGALGENVPMYKFMVQGDEPGAYTVDTSFSPAQAVNSSWTAVTQPGKDYYAFKQEEQQYVYVYAYAQNGSLVPLRKGQITAPLFDKLRLWNFNEQFSADNDHGVCVEGFGIQTDLPGYEADDIAEIWEILKGEGGS